MPITRTNITLGDATTEPSVAWENEIKNSINNLKDNAVDTTDGNINATSITAGASSGSGSAGNRSLIFKVTDTIQKILRWDNTAGWMKLLNQAGALLPLAVADPTDATHAMTLGYFNVTRLFPKGYMNGVTPVWQSASTVRIPSGFSCRDATDTADMVVTSNLDAVLSSSGAGGLDTGSEASNTTYYLWLIAKADGTLAAMFSTSVSSPTMPTDYIYKRRMKGAWRNNASSNLLEMQYGPGYPYRPLCLYDVPMTIGASAGATNIGNTSSTSYAAYDCTAFAPEAITKLVLLHVAANTGNSAVVVRPGDETGDHQTVGMATGSGGGQRGFSDLIRIDPADGTIDAKLETASGTHYIDVKGFVDTLGD